MVKIILSENNRAWDDYVQAHQTASLYHTFRWQKVIKKTYGHRVYYLMAVGSDEARKVGRREGERVGAAVQRAEGIAHRGKELEKGGSGQRQEIERLGSGEAWKRQKVRGCEDKRVGVKEVGKWRTDKELKAEIAEISEGHTPTKNFEPSAMSYELDSSRVVGILPLVHINHFLFGNSLISMPYFDMGGILADNEETEKALLTEAVKIGQELKVKNIDLRHTGPLSWLNAGSQLKAESSKENIATNSINALSSVIKRQQTTDNKQLSPAKPANSINSANSINFHPACPVGRDYRTGVKFRPDSEVHLTGATNSTNPTNSINSTTRSSKVRMILELPDSADELMRSFKAKLRSQIKKPIKEGLTAKIGNRDFLDDFYKVFAVNMRDLGSPVHSKDLIQNVLAEFPDEARLVLIYKDREPVAGSVIIGFKDHLQNPWSSALRQYSRLSPNMLLYWTMLEYACNQGLKYFDFGRSTPSEGTFKFKEQWGAKPQPLHWISISLKGEKSASPISEDSKFQLASEVWKKLPVPIANTIGPMIRRYISL